jgi:hypothetical protein
MDINNANTLSIMRHRIKPQNTSMGHVFQHLFFLEVYTNSQPVLSGETHVCAERVFAHVRNTREQETPVVIGKNLFLDQEIPAAGFVRIQDSSQVWEE